MIDRSKSLPTQLIGKLFVSIIVFSSKSWRQNFLCTLGLLETNLQLQISDIFSLIDRFQPYANSIGNYNVWFLQISDWQSSLTESAANLSLISYTIDSKSLPLPLGLDLWGG